MEKEERIQVGDKITYKNSMGKIRQVIIKDEEQKIKYLNNTNAYSKILKIERTTYEVVEENKELFTDEEREFLKDICKYYNIIEIEFGSTSIYFVDVDQNVISNFDYPQNMNFENVEKNKFYTLKELEQGGM